MDTQWALNGTYMEACTCEAACPCMMLSDPTEGTCTSVVGWHIDEGHAGDLTFQDLNVVLALHSPGNMAEGNWKAALYLDDRTSADQQEAFVQIFGGEAGGHPAELATFISEVRGVETVPLTFESNGNRGRIRIGEVGEAISEPIEGPGGEVPTVEHVPLGVAPGYPAMVGRSKRARFDDHGIRFDVSGRSTLLSPFSYAGP